MNVLAISLVVAFFIAAFLFLFHKLASRGATTARAGEGLEDFSLERYAPMERLLDKSDLAFLAAQPGYHRAISSRLLRERRKIFVGYLRLLTRDFKRLVAIAKLMRVQSAEDRPELATALLRQQMTFYFAVAVVRCRLALFPLGWPAVEGRKLVHALGEMRDQVEKLELRRVGAGLG
jgi:hypothetical protein